MERARLMGSWIGTLAVINKQAQSILVLINDSNESQQLADGVKPLLVLPVMKLAHGVKVLVIIEVVQGVLICCPINNFSEVIKSDDITVI